MKSPFHFLFCLFALACPPIVIGSSQPINLWYGNSQEFGSGGKAQRYVNLVGNLDRSMDWKSLEFSLNGSPRHPLAWGPDDRRLQRAGDFNVEIPYDHLQSGDNQILIKAQSTAGEYFEEWVSVRLADPVPNAVSEINWKNVRKISDVAQVIDGFWRIENDSLVSDPDFAGYDRVIGFGDMNWKDFEVLFPFEVTGLDNAAYGSDTSIAPAVLFTLRWQGHTDAPVPCWQPHCGWEPFGGLVSYSFREHNEEGMEIYTRWQDEFVNNPALHIIPGVKYWIRLRSETSGLGNVYSLKLWSGALDKEPLSWSMRAIANPLNLTQGAFLVVAHHINLQVGNMYFTHLGNLRHRAATFLTETASTLVWLPYLVIWLVGIFWGRVYQKRDPSRGRWVTLSFAIVFVTSLVGFFLITYLPEYLQNSGWITRRLTYVYLAINLIPIAGHILGWGLLMWKLTPPKIAPK